MKHILILYFTGTFHTEQLVQKIEKETDSLWFTTTLCIKSESEIISLESYDTILFCYPIHAFRPPKPYLNYLKKLSYPKTAHYYVIKQSGEPFSINNSSSVGIEKILHKAGVSLSGEYHFLFPYNILFPFPENWKKRIQNYNESLFPYVIDTIDNDREHHLSYSFFSRMTAGFVAVLEHFGSHLNSLFFHVKRKQCLQCHLCEKQCPMNNIRFKKGYPSFSIHCCLCMRCSYYCPNAAIRIGILNPLRVNRNSSYKETFLTRKFFRAYEKRLKELQKEQKL